MNWVTRVRNAIPFIAKRETAETLWHKCKGCQAMIFLKEDHRLTPLALVPEVSGDDLPQGI